MEVAITQLVPAYHERQMQEAARPFQRIRETGNWSLFKLVGDELKALREFESALQWYSRAFDLCSDINKFDLAEDVSAMEAGLDNASEAHQQS